MNLQDFKALLNNYYEVAMRRCGWRKQNDPTMPDGGSVLFVGFDAAKKHDPILHEHMKKIEAAYKEMDEYIISRFEPPRTK